MIKKEKSKTKSKTSKKKFEMDELGKRLLAYMLDRGYVGEENNINDDNSISEAELIDNFMASPFYDMPYIQIVALLKAKGKIA